MNRIVLEIHITAAHAHCRLDHALAQIEPDYSRSKWQQWIKSGFVTLNGTPCTVPRTITTLDDHVRLDAPIEEQTTAEAQAIPLDIAYEDDALLIINKAAGRVVHPGAGQKDQTLMNALLHYHPPLSELPRAGLIHRLDKDTTGLLLVAKTLVTYNTLIKAMQEREIKRCYQAIVYGKLIAGGCIDQPVGRHLTRRTAMAVTAQGKPARTHYQLIKKFEHFTHLRVQLETGRTHQIRVHFAHIRHPLLGDPLYAKGRHQPSYFTTPLTRQLLHAYELTLTHPQSGEQLQVQANLPADFQAVLQTLETHEHDH